MHRHLFVVLVALTACDRADSPESAAARQQLADARASCVKVFQRQRACTTEFIPALVDLRRDLDKPSGIREAAREEVIAAALEEWKSDSTDEAIGSVCDRMAPKATPAQVSTGDQCAALNACGEFVTCVIPMMREHLSK